MSIIDTLRHVKQFDDTRPSIPGEHWFALAVGLGLLALSNRGRSTPMRSLASVAGYGFLLRAASGRDGLKRFL